MKITFKTKYKIILAIFIISFISSLFLSQGFACTSACELDSSEISSFLLDKEVNGYVGMAIFLILSLVTFFHMRNPTKIKKRVIYAGIMVGSVIAIYFIYLQIFVLESFCKYCMIIDVGLLITLLLILFTWRK